VTSQTRLAHTAGFLHLGQSRRRAAAVNMPGSRTCRPGLTAASTGTPSKAEEPRYQPQDQQPVYTDTLTSSGARLAMALAAREVQAHRTLAANPDPADQVRVARVQALITSTTSILTEAAARKGHIDSGVLQRLAPALDADQVARSRLAKRWGELTSPASRTGPALVGTASEGRSAIAAAATKPTGWATPDQLASRVDLPTTVTTLHLRMVASVDLAYVVRDTAAEHSGLTAPARIIGVRSQGEAEIAIEQGETLTKASPGPHPLQSRPITNSAARAGPAS
jgi:hypothetical protein